MEDKDSFPSVLRLHGLTLTNRMFFVPLSSPVLIVAPKWLNVSLFFLVCISVGPSKRGGLPSSPVLQQQMPVGCRCYVVTNVESCVDGQHGKCVGSIGAESLDILNLPIRH